MHSNVVIITYQSNMSNQIEFTHVTFTMIPIQ